MAEAKELGGKVALVTGASSGLGREFALSFAKWGCNVVVTARRTELLESLCQEIDQLPGPGKAAAVPLDVSGTHDQIDAAIERAWKHFGRIDVLINNAGFRGNVRSPLDLELDEWNKVFATNLRGSWLVSKAVAKHMRDAKQGGSIINISSIDAVGRGHIPGTLAYAASKEGVNTMTKVMAIELGKYDIRVNAIAAGLFRSEITAELMKKDWLHRVATKIVPLQKWGELDPALTSVIHLLASDSSAYITGNIFIVDGGVTLAGIPLYSSL